MILSRKNYIPFVLVLAVLVMLAVALPARAITVPQDVTLETTNGADVTMLANSQFDELTINANSFTFTMSGSQQVNLRDDDAQVMKTNVDGVTYVCNSQNSELKLDASKATSFQVELEGFACSSGGGGGSNATSPSTDTTTTTDSSTTTTTEDTTATDTTTTTETTTDSQYLDGAPPVSSLGGAVASLPPTPGIPPFSPAQFPVVASISRGLTVGSQGDDVRALQEALASMPDVYPEGLVTGYFGSLTRAAVAAFQMKYGVVSSSADPGYGYVGPMTRAKLVEVFHGPPITPSGTVPASVAVILGDLDPGDSGVDVTKLQVYLAADADLYPEGLVTGYYGSLTTAAVKRFQAKYGIAQVGRVGPQTRAKLNEVMGGGSLTTLVSPPSPQSPAGTASEEAALQAQIQQLNDLINSLQQQIQAAQ